MKLRSPYAAGLAGIDESVQRIAGRRLDKNLFLDGK